MPLRNFLACLDSDEYQTLGFLMFSYYEHVWFIGCIFNTPYLTCAFSMHCTQPPLAHTSATLVMHWSISCFFILACHIYLMLCSILFCLLFELLFSFILHSSCIIFLVHTFISCLLFSLTLLSISRAHLQGERYSIREMHIPRGRIHCVNQKNLFCLFSCWLYGVLSYALLFSSHHVCMLDMLTSLCYCASLNACLDDHFLYHVIFVVISL